jgi:hypothetical protein
MSKSFRVADIPKKSEAHLGRGKDKFVSFCCSDDDDAYPALYDIAETDISASAMARYFFFLRVVIDAKKPLSLLSISSSSSSPSFAFAFPASEEEVLQTAPKPLSSAIVIAIEEDDRRGSKDELVEFVILILLSLCLYVCVSRERVRARLFSAARARTTADDFDDPRLRKKKN